MPKARNHPHHHSVAERRARASRLGELQFPQWNTGWFGPIVRMPPGWERKSPAEFLSSPQGCRLVALLVGSIVALFVVIVLLAQVIR